jgi:translation initiation factor IF-1
MPGLSAHTMKKGKTSKIAMKRKETNKRTVDLAVRGDLEDCEFGRVIKHLGNSRIRIICEDKREYNAVIRGLLRRKGITPISTDDIVVLGKREWESRMYSDAMCFDVMAVLSRREVDRLKKEERIPDWMSSGEAKTDDAQYEFEYGPSHGDKDFLEMDGSDNEDIDINAI